MNFQKRGPTATSITLLLPALCESNPSPGSGALRRTRGTNEGRVQWEIWLPEQFLLCPFLSLGPWQRELAGGPVSDAMERGWCLHGSGDPAAPTGPLLTQLAPSSLRFISLEYLQSSAQCNAKLLLHCSVSALLYHS